ncbi:MAG: tryptophan 7-halogenase [Thermoanaerobaculia bacterium]|nr:tryptophan 7-halogenase [Thermoanaerobaculia bacterium]
MLDVLVIGGGPAGSTAATLLARKGFSVRLLERDKFPRFQIGESLLPYNNDLFDRLGVSDELKRGEYFPKYGAHFVTGDGRTEFTFRFDRILPPEHQRSFQVRRSEFDHLLLRNAAASGVDVREETPVTSVRLENESCFVRVASGEEIEARFVIDGSGHASLLGSRTGKKSDIASLKKIAVFAHYRGVEKPKGRDAGNTTIVVIRDGWFWLIPVTGELMSVGLVVDRDHFVNCGLSAEELLERSIAATPFVAERMKSAGRVTQVYSRKDFSYRVRDLVGKRFALIGDAAGFLDPIFSTGVYMAMKSADIAADAVEARLRKGSMRGLERYERDMTRALGRYFHFISNFYRREFLEVFLQPSNRFGLLHAIVRILAGNVFGAAGDRLKLALFFVLVRIQKRRPVIARPIRWEALPRAASL